MPSSQLLSRTPWAGSSLSEALARGRDQQAAWPMPASSHNLDPAPLSTVVHIGRLRRAQPLDALCDRLHRAPAPHARESVTSADGWSRRAYKRASQVAASQAALGAQPRALRLASEHATST